MQRVKRFVVPFLKMLKEHHSHQIKQKLHSISANTHTQLCFGVFKEQPVDHPEAPVLLQCQQSHFEFLGTKTSQAFKGLHLSPSPSVIRLQEEERTDYAHDGTALYQCTFSEFSNPTPRLV